jgi:hypothetical protein
MANADNSILDDLPRVTANGFVMSVAAKPFERQNYSFAINWPRPQNGGRRLLAGQPDVSRTLSLATMEAVHEPVAGIDVDRMRHVVRILIQQADGTVSSETREFAGFNLPTKFNHPTTSKGERRS